jgi:hypothetical protein
MLPFSGEKSPQLSFACLEMRRITTRECELPATTTTAGEAAHREPVHRIGQNAHVSFVCSTIDFSAQIRRILAGVDRSDPKL